MGEPADETVTVADSPATCKEPMSVVRYWCTWCVQRNPIVVLVIYDHIYCFQYTWKLNLTFADAQILPGLQGKPLPFSFPPTHEERHQWLELTLRPSLQTYVCDLWVADAVGNDALRWSIVEEGFCLGSIFSYSCWNFQEWQRQEERQAYQNHTVEPLGGLSKSALSQRELQHWPTNLSRRTKWCRAARSLIVFLLSRTDPRNRTQNRPPKQTPYSRLSTWGPHPGWAHSLEAYPHIYLKL